MDLREQIEKMEPTDNNNGDLSYDEKLNFIKNEVQSWHKFCLEKKLTDKEIHNCVSVMYGPKKSVVKKTLDDSAKSLLILAVIGAIIAVPFAHRGSMRFFQGNVIFFMKSILPYWDFTFIFYEECIVNNYWKEDNSPPAIDYKFCSYCRNITIPRFSNVSQSYLGEKLGENDLLPFVVTDTAAHGNTKNLSMDEIIHLYQHHPELSEEKMRDCEFQSNYGKSGRFKYSSEFFNAYVTKLLPPIWHARWTNCDAKAAKVFRAYNPRPYFLPFAMQLELGGTIITSKGMNSSDSHRMITGGSYADVGGMVVSVFSGSLNITLKPRLVCVKEFNCTQVAINLFPDEVLFYNTNVWQMNYYASDSGVTIAMSNEVLWYNFQ